jgi:hypothetical protein
MAQIKLEGSEVWVTLSGWEKFLSLRRHDLMIPSGSIRTAELVADPRQLLRQTLRGPGLNAGRLRRVGTFKAAGRRIFASIRGAGPALWITTDGGPGEVNECVIGVDSASEWADRLGAVPRTSPTAAG